jgi:hypothetical protein
MAIVAIFSQLEWGGRIYTNGGTKSDLFVTLASSCSKTTP